MSLIEKVEKLIKEATQASEVIVSGEGCNCDVTVISDKFEGMSLLNRQRMVNAAVTDLIASGELHALSIKTRTPE